MAPSAKPEIEARRKKVFELYFTLGLSLQQIAAQVGFDVATVSSDLAKMRKEFAQAYELKHEPNEVINREIEKLQLVAEKAWREYHGLREQGLKPHILTPADAKNQATLTRARLLALREAREASISLINLLQDLGLAERHLGTIHALTGKDVMQAINGEHHVADDDLTSPAEKKYTVQ